MPQRGRRKGAVPESGAAALAEDQQPAREERHGAAEKTEVDLGRPAYRTGPVAAVLIFISLAVAGESRKGPGRDHREGESRNCQQKMEWAHVSSSCECSRERTRLPGMRQVFLSRIFFGFKVP